MIKVGKYTAALLLIVVGSFLLIDLTMDKNLSNELINWWPVIIILLGIEYLLFSSIYRGPERKLSFAVGSLFLSIILSALVIGYTAFPNGLFNANINIGNFTFSDKVSKPYDKGITIVPVPDNQNKVNIINPNGDIEIITADTDEIQIATTLYVNKLKDKEADSIAEQSSVEYQTKGNTTIIEAKAKEYRMFGIKQKPKMDMIITVPMDLAVDYELDMTNGTLVANGIAVREKFDVDTTNGNITIHNIRAQVSAHSTNGKLNMENIVGDVNLDTTNGSIQASDVDGDLKSKTTNGKVTVARVSGDVDVKTTNGSLTLTDVHEDVKAKTTNGGITIRTNELAGDWELETTNGELKIYLPEHSDFEMDGEAGLGSVHSDFPLTINKKQVSGVIGTGQYEINAETNGKIGIYRE